MTQPNETERPDFERYKHGISDFSPEGIGKGIRWLRPTHLAYLIVGGIAAFAVYKDNGWAGAVLAVVLSLMLLIHCVMVDKGHVKNINEEEDDTIELVSVRSDP